MGNSFTNGGYSIAMLDYRRVSVYYSSILEAPIFTDMSVCDDTVLEHFEPSFGADDSSQNARQIRNPSHYKVR